MIATDRLVLHPLTVEDADEMVDVLADPRLYEFTGGAAPTLDELRTRYARQVAGRSSDGSQSWLNWVVRLAADERPIGFVQATIVDGSADIAWVIGTPWQGNGYASEAALALIGWLEVSGIASITAHIHPNHVASAAVAKAAGLQPTERLEEGEVVWIRRTQHARSGTQGAR